MIDRGGGGGGGGGGAQEYQKMEWAGHFNQSLMTKIKV